MGAFTNPLFMNEFAMRTKMNYYQLRLRQELSYDEREHVEQEIESLVRQMERRKYTVDDFYEVTQLVNSMIGLLVFPEQSAYYFLPEEEEEIHRYFPILSKYINGKKGYYSNTYYEGKKTDLHLERNGPKNIIRHLRNAAAHKEIGIFPENGTLTSGETIIQSITFKDRKKSNPEYLFELRIDVTDLEELLMEICNYIIDEC